MASRLIHVPGPVDLRRTVGALGMKASRHSTADRFEAWWATRTPVGPATLHIEAAQPALRAEAWGPGSDWVLEHAPRVVGVDDRPEEFDPPRGLVRDLQARAPGLRIGKTWRVFEALIPAVLGQKVATREANAAGRQLLLAHGEPAPGPTPLRMLPEPAAVASLSYWDLHPLGIERKRAEVLLEVARRAPRLEEIVSMDAADAYKRLTAVRGVGPWTAGHVMGVAWGDPDAVPVGDYHLPNTVAFALAGEARGDDERMLELLEPFRGHRRRVMLLLKGAGIKAPKYGPRRALRSIENI